MALVLVLAGLLVTAMSGSAAANKSINYDAGPNPGIEETTEIATHKRASMGVLQYEDDGGDVTDLPAHLNTSKDEQVEVRFDKINDSILVGTFYRDYSGWI